MTDPATIQAWAAQGGDRYPGAVWMPLPENATQSVITPRAFILHTQAGPRTSTNAQVFTYMSNPAVTNEPTFLLQMDGELWQTMGLFTRADSNYKANNWTLSVETQDLGSATLDQTPWTEAQLQTLAEISAYLSLHPGIRLQLAPVTVWDGAGIAPHNAFSRWSAAAHSCPGKARTAQVPEVIGRAKAIAAWKPAPVTPPEVIEPPAPQEDRMATARITVEGRNAQFYGTGTLDAAGNVHCLMITWSGPGDQPFHLDHSAAPDTVHQHYQPDTLRRDLVLVGNPADIRDDLHVWTAGDFARVS